MAKIVPLHPHLVSAHQDGIISSIEDQDNSLRMRALDLVSPMSELSRDYPALSQDSATSALPSAAQSLERTAAAVASDVSGYLISWCIIAMCSHDAYENVTDFEWYLCAG
ncbi:hypothetical protein BS47DRAFT_1396242 [Hydnum rufescens UP504]|uniref:Uncharacterized protein n=1 Tax=Hydnum rufescens UP504 TaxID=1448309 RepID=A0A9P6AR64_9AGAM|nr:hypothetical protein BS47DRAFT_1396242 [Hydnum rufescens UP504]